MIERADASGGTTGIPVLDPEEIEPTEPVQGLLVRTSFRLEGYRLELLEVGGRTAWHRREGTVHAWVRAGAGRLGFGPDGAGPEPISAGDFLRVPPALVHRYEADVPLELLAVVDGETVPTDPPTDPPGESVPEIVGPDGLVPGPESPGLTRETPFPDEEVLMMRVRAAGGAAAGWHHHGGNIYFGYAVDGPSETEYGPDGAAVARIEIGECFHVPPGLVHRDTNPGEEAHTGIIWLCGGPPWVVNVDGPA